MLLNTHLKMQLSSFCKYWPLNYLTLITTEPYHTFLTNHSLIRSIHYISEPSTSNLLRMYGHYVKHLKLSLKNQNLRWSGERFHLLTKVIVRFLLVFIRTGVQLQSFKLVAWFDMHWFKKVKYHLSRFLRYSLFKVSNRIMN